MKVKTKFEPTVEFDPYQMDDTWGIGFVSSLPISGIRARITLADDKRICGANIGNKQFQEEFKAGCRKINLRSFKYTFI